MRILSCVQPTGNLHIGNYLGSVSQWVSQLNANPGTEAFFGVVDQHAITVPQDPKQLRQKIYEILAIYLAAGIDPDKHTVFVQSLNPDHSYLSWVFTCITPVGWMERMTQYKDKRQKLEDYQTSVSMGLMSYPILMAADILLYDADQVPVGADQKQHVEITADIAEKFNSQFGQTFKVPEFVTSEVTTKILDLQDPSKKMSKSDANPNGKIELMDTPQGIQDKIKRAITDSVGQVGYDPDTRPGMSNLVTLFAATTNSTPESIVQRFEGKGYGDFKKELAESIILFLEPIQKKIQLYLSDLAELDRIIDNGTAKARAVSSRKIDIVKDKIGFYSHVEKK